MVIRHRYTYRKLKIQITHLLFRKGMWRGEAVLAVHTGSSVYEYKRMLDVYARNEHQALNRAIQQCNEIVDENLGRCD